MKTIFLISLISLPTIGFSQIINSNETTIAEFYDGQVKSVELNGAKVTGQLRLWTYFTYYKVKQDEKGDEKRSARKNNSLFLNGGLTNTGSTLLNLNKFDLNEKNGFTFGLSYQHSFDRIYLINNPKNPFPLISYTFAVNFQQDKFKNFDPTTNSISTSKPSRISVKAGYSKYFFNYKQDKKIKYAVVPTLFGTVNLQDYNKTTLQNYILEDNSSSAGDIIFTKNSNFDGKYGTVNNKLKSAQVGFSLPVITEKLTKILPVISPIPYISYEVFEKGKPRLNGGIAIGVLASSIVNNKIEKDEDGDEYRTFNVPSYITIGVDWNYQNGQGSKPNYFIAGSIKFK